MLIITKPDRVADLTKFAKLLRKIVSGTCNFSQFFVILKPTFSRVQDHLSVVYRLKNEEYHIKARLFCFGLQNEEHYI